MKWHLVTDNFPGTSLGALWVSNHGTVSVAGNKMVLSTGAFSGAVSAAHDLTDSHLLLRAEPPAGNNPLQLGINVGPASDGNNRLVMWKQGLLLHLYRIVAGTPTDVTVTFDATAHAWWRIRQDSTANEVYYETAPDGLTWTVQRTITTPAFGSAMTAVALEIWAGDTTATQDVFASKLNLPPGAVGSGNPLWSSVTDDFAGTALSPTRWASEQNTDVAGNRLALTPTQTTISYPGTANAAGAAGAPLLTLNLPSGAANDVAYIAVEDTSGLATGFTVPGATLLGDTAPPSGEGSLAALYRLPIVGTGGVALEITATKPGSPGGGVPVDTGPAVGTTDSTVGNSMAVTVPAHAAGDLLVVMVTINQPAGAVNVPVGWSSPGATVPANAFAAARVLYRFAPTTEVAATTQTVAFDSFYKATAVCQVFPNVDTVTPIGGYSARGSATSGESPVVANSVTTTADGGQRVVLGAYNVTGTPVTVAGFTQEAVATGVAGTDTQSVIYTENVPQASAGATGNVSLGNGAFTAWIAFQLILNPAAGVANWAALEATAIRVSGLDPTTPNGTVQPATVTDDSLASATHRAHVVDAGDTSLLVSVAGPTGTTWTGPVGYTERLDTRGMSFRTRSVASTETVAQQNTTASSATGGKFGWALELRSAGASPAEAVSNRYDLTGSSVAVRADLPEGGQPFTFELRTSVDNQRLTWSRSAATTLLAQMDTGSGATTTTIAYNATQMAWLRIRHDPGAGGTILWETSPDGSVWTVRRSAAAPAFGVTALEARFQTPSGSGSGTGYFAKLNLGTPPVDPFPQQPVGQPIGSFEATIDNGLLMLSGVATGGPTGPGTNPGATGLFEVRAGRIFDPNGVKFVPVGASLMGPNGFWNDSPAANAALLQTNWKFNLVRIITCLPGGCECCTAQTQTTANDLDAIVAAYTSRKMVVLIDYHQLNEGSTPDAAELAAATTFWVEKANAYKTNPYVWFNLFNGTEQGAGAPARWRTQHQGVVNAIRAAGAPNIIVVDDTNFGAGASVKWSSANVAVGQSGVIDEGAALTDSEGRIVWGVHMDNVWGPPSNLAGSTLFTDTQRNARLRDYLTRATAGGRPVLIDFVGFMAADSETTGTSWECTLPGADPCPSTGSAARLAAKAAYAVAPEFDVGIVAWAGFPLMTAGEWAATQAQLTTFGQWHRGYATSYATQVGQGQPGPDPGGPGGGTIPATGQFEAQGKRIYDPQGREFVPMGTNLAGPNSFWVDNPASLAATLQTDWGFNAVRIFTCLASGCECCRSTPIWTNANDLQAIVTAYTQRQMVVMIDYHQLQFGSTATQAQLAEAEAFWVGIANTYKTNPYVWFNLFNEPEFGSGAPQRWLTQHQRIVNAIRAAGAPNLIVVDDTYSGQGTGVWWDVNPVPVGYSGILDRGDDLVDPLDRVAYSLHTYDAWGFPSTGDGGTRFTDAQRDAKLQDYIDRATASGRPLMFGEFGFYDWEQETTGSSYHCTLSGPCPNTGSAQRLAVKAMASIGVRNHVGVFMWNGFPASTSGVPSGRGWGVTTRTALGNFMFDYVTRMRTALTVGGGEEPGGPGTPTGRFTLAGSIIRDPDGNNFLPMGINATGASSYIWPDQWNAHGKADAWKALGYNSIRLVYCTTCASHSPGSRNYGSIDSLIQEYTSRKMVVIIDNHEGVLGPGGGKTQAEVNQAIAFFTPLAQAYKDNPYVWFEPFNEPQEEGWMVPAASAWRDYTEAVIAAIRGTGAQNIVVANASHYGQDRAGSGALTVNQSAILTYGPGILSRQTNVVFDVHIYSRYGTNANVSDANMVAQFGLYRSAGLAVLVGETGGYADAFCGAVCPGDRQGTEALYRVRPPDVGILPWMVGEFQTAGGGTVDDPSRLHFQWMANPPNFSDGTAVGGGGGGGGSGAWPVPINGAAVPASTSIAVSWARPTTNRNITGVFVSWGWNGVFQGSTSLAASATTHNITSVPSGTSVTIDIGFIVDGVFPGQGNFARVNATTTGGGGGGGPTSCTSAPSGPSAVGPAVSTFETVASQADLTRLGLPGSWSTAQQQWSCNGMPSGGLRGLRILGAFYYTATAPCVMEDCIVENSGSSFAIVFCASGAGAPRLRRCRLSRPVQANITYGAGVVEFNGQNDGWVEFCDLSGNADGIQLSGNNHRIYRNLFHDLVVRGPADGSGTHNDGIQVFSGTNLQITENFFNLGTDPGHSNAAIFTQGGGIGRLDISGNRFVGSGYQINAQNGQLCLTNNCFELPRLFGAMVIVGGASVICNTGNTGT